MIQNFMEPFVMPSPNKLVLRIFHIWIFLLLFFLVALPIGCSHTKPSTESHQEGPSHEDALASTHSQAAASMPSTFSRSGDRIRIRKTIDDDDNAFSRPTDDDVIDLGIENQNILDEAIDYCQLAQDFWQKGKLENALQALDTAYSLILKLNTQGRPRLIQQKDDLRHLISKRIMEIYASRNLVRPANHNVIPMSMNRHVQAEIDLLTKGAEKDFFINAYQRSGRYREWIEAELVKEGLPKELSWLPLIESGYKSNAFSPARALGLWQFIASTGYRFGLNRDQFVDERLDPYKSTRAAILYLKELHSLFGDWETALAAYNCGENRVLRTISSQRVNYLDNFWDLYEKLPQETARYVPRFIATLHIVSDPKKYGLEDISPEPPLAFETIDIFRNIHLKHVAQATDTPLPYLKLLNPELRLDITPAEGYTLKIPPGTRDLLLSKLDEIPDSMDTPTEAPAKPDIKHTTHLVAKGETIQSIAKKYGIPASEIAKLNKSPKSGHIKPGTVLVLPHPSMKTAATSPQKASAEPAKPTKAVTKIDPKAPIVHTVQKGENLFSIASRYGTTVQAIQKLNNFNTINLTIGQTLQIPFESVSSAKPLISLKKYEVKKGDSPTSIARTHQMPIERFLSINNLTEKSRLLPGQKVYVE
uniref:LysM peptidoglycan-binding domain-containing protein n=1 Tax=Desulfatirhabdium butyrativorans TaxID=340467 RepID=A0A7C4MPF2_9BACT